jgi:hypothetical protein
MTQVKYYDHYNTYQKFVYDGYSKYLGHYENKLEFDLVIKSRNCRRGELKISKEYCYTCPEG